MKPRITLRVNGTRIGETARPADDSANRTSPIPGQRLPTRRAFAPLRVNNAAALVRDYRDCDGSDDDGVAS